MTWFKVDDGFWSHPKALTASSTAVGVWVRVGAYCAQHLTDGLIDAQTVFAICPDRRRVVEQAIAELIGAGLWEEVEPGRWRYHDWADQQPSRQAVEARRAADRAKKRRQRRAPNGQFMGDMSRGDAPGDSRGESDRPDPTRPVKYLEVASLP